MALRVLLADESNTIKKVFQLALQDYAVDVRPVNIGLDVLQVAEKFNPDIVFADVLLQKKSGYEVCAEIKNHSGLARTPVVLMWSGFMELDQDRFEASGAEGRLEKPFDVNSLRSLVQKLVPKTSSQQLSQYLSFPKMPEMISEQPKGNVEEPAPRATPTATTGTPGAAPPPAPQATPSQVQATPPPVAAAPQAQASPPPLPQDPPPPASAEAATTEEAELSEWSIESFDPIRNTVVQEPAQPMELQELETESEDQDSWQQTDLSRFKVDLDPSTEDEDLPTETLFRPEAEETEIHHSSATSQEALEVEEELPLDWGPEPQAELETETLVHPQPHPQPQQGAAAAVALTGEQIEEIIRHQAQEMIEAAVWKVVPELAQQIIERELKKILEEKESDLY